MILFFHNLGSGNPITDLLFILVIIGGWSVSTFLVFRGIFRFIKTVWKLKLLFITFVLFAIWMLVLYVVPIPSEIFDRSALSTFPFGFFAGIPFLIIFDTRDLFVYGILLFLGSILNAVAIINFADYLAKKYDAAFE